jgi:hypothetical protein
MTDIQANGLRSAIAVRKASSAGAVSVGSMSATQPARVIGAVLSIRSNAVW